ncbi:MAG: NTP transferase domain-containing protein [Gammaproteobacteria bacterium]|mgnify:CR=1 FL=1|nr:NTP transferase domain-containing protein [Gammaproteobacteria bacterium]
MTDAPDFVWVILAAGGSTRLGEPKQLLTLGETTLIYHQASTFLATGLPVCVISGAIELSPYIPNHKNVTIIHNSQWQKGLGSSVMLAQQHYPESHIGWVLVDQYAITTEQALAFYTHWQQQPCLALVSRYGTEQSAWGVPVITHKQLLAKTEFPERGLKPWLMANHQQVKLQYYDWPQAQLDLDTPAQWQNIQHQYGWKGIVL